MSNRQWNRDYNATRKILSKVLVTEDGVLERLHEDQITNLSIDIVNKQFQSKDNAARYFNNQRIRDELELKLGKFIFLHYGEILSCEIPTKYLFRFIYLSTYVNYENVLMRTQRTPMTKSDIKEALSLPNRTEVSDTFKAFMLYDLLIEKDDKFIVNPKYISRGKMKKGKRNVNSNFSKLFINGIQRLYESTKRLDDKDLGYLFLLLPYVNKHYNFLCNANHINYDLIERIKRLNTVDICKILNLGRKKTLNTLLNLRVDGMPVLMGILVGSNKTEDMKYYVNPFIFYQGNYIKNKRDIDFLIREFESQRQEMVA